METAKNFHFLIIGMYAIHSGEFLIATIMNSTQQEENVKSNIRSLVEFIL